MNKFNRWDGLMLLLREAADLCGTGPGTGPWAKIKGANIQSETVLISDVNNRQRRVCFINDPVKSVWV